MTPAKDEAAVGGGLAVWTIGHSTRPLEELLGMLRAARITLLVDVRRFPASRRYPHFNGPALQKALAAADIRYHHDVDLGGRREPRPDSPNAAWRNAAFRGYADQMATPAFQAARARLIALARAGSPAILCAEAVPWRCHRQLIADALVACEVEVVHLIGPDSSRPHVLAKDAVVDDGVVVYPGAGSRALFEKSPQR